MALPMLPTPMIADSGICHLLRQQSEVLIRAHPVDGLPVLGDDPVLDPEEILGREVRRLAALRDRAVPHASGSDAVALGDHVRLCGAAVRHRSTADPNGACKILATLR